MDSEDLNWRISLRLAVVGEAADLSDLAMRSKAYWGYDDAFMEMCREELTMHREAIEAGNVWVAESGGGTAGFVELIPGVPEAELRMIFVEPEAIGRGVGRVLWGHAEALARRHGASRIGVDSDPYAENFYRSMGAVRVGEAPSGSIPGRMLPRLVKRLDEEAAPTAR